MHVVDLSSHMPWFSRGGTRVSPGLIARQMEEVEEERKMSTSRSIHISRRCPPRRAAEDRQERYLPATDRRPVSRVELGQTRPPGRGSTIFVSVSHSHHKTSRLCVETKRCWTLAEDSLSEWEELKKSRAGGGAPCESRKTVFFLPLPWQAIPVTIRPDCGCWATSRRERSRALQVCLSCTCCSRCACTISRCAFRC